MKHPTPVVVFYTFAATTLLWVVVFAAVGALADGVERRRHAPAVEAPLIDPPDLLGGETPEPAPTLRLPTEPLAELPALTEQPLLELPEIPTIDVEYPDPERLPPLPEPPGPSIPPGPPGTSGGPGYTSLKEPT